MIAAYQGAPGAFSEEAAWALAGADATLLPCATLTSVLATVSDGRATDAIVPIENSLAGTVPHAYELLVDHGLTAIGETRLRIDHMLIGHPSAQLDDIRRVHSHPVALDQCRRFIRARAFDIVSTFDTAGAVAEVLSGGDRTSAAIASRRAAELHGATILAERIQDYAENWTRFLRLVPVDNAPPMRGPNAIVTFRLRHEAGSLSRALQALAEAGLNLTKIESRPIADQPFEYAFLIELTATKAETSWGDALASLAGVTTSARLVAAY